jgi:hypothetical protein
LSAGLAENFCPFVVRFVMPKKQNSNSQAQVLQLLKDVLPKAVTDQKLVDKIYSACEKEISAKARVEHFEKFCTKADLPDLKSESVEEIQRQFEESFGAGRVSIIPHEKKQAATVEVVLQDQVLEGVIKVGAAGNGEEEDPEFKPKFVPFPVSLDSDPELIWVLARGETLTTQEAAVFLTKAQDDFWASKQGQTLIRKKRIDRSFPEFMKYVPSKLLTEVGLKRHYKEPEALKQIKRAQ